MISARGQANVSVTANANQVEFQGAFALGSAVALQVNAGIVKPKDEDNGDGGSGHLFEGGLGYYRNITPTVLFDIYALAGAGTMKNDFPSTLASSPSTTGKIEADILRFGVQPSVSVHRRRFSHSNISGNLIFGSNFRFRWLEASTSRRRTSSRTSRWRPSGSTTAFAEPSWGFGGPGLQPGTRGTG